MMFELAGEIQIAAGGDDEVEQFAAGTGADGGGSDLSFGRADKADGPGAGCAFDFPDEGIHGGGDGQIADTAEAPSGFEIAMAKNVECRRFVWVGFAHSGNDVGDPIGRDDGFQANFGDALEFSAATDGRM